MLKNRNFVSDFKVTHYVTKLVIWSSCVQLHTFFISWGNFPFNVSLGLQWKIKIALVILKLLKLYTMWQNWSFEPLVLTCTPFLMTMFYLWKLVENTLFRYHHCLSSLSSVPTRIGKTRNSDKNKNVKIMRYIPILRVITFIFDCYYIFW